MRRRLLLAALLPSLLLTSCIPNDEEGVVLRISTWGGAGEGNEFDKLVQSFYRQFEAENPGVKIRIEPNPGGREYVQKMMLNFVAKTEPDIMIVDASSSAVFINNGVLADLMPIIEKDPDFNLDDYFPNVVDIGRRGDKLYTIPSDFTPMVMYYNRKLFDEAGVPYPKSGWSFNDFLSTAEKLTDSSKGQYGFVATKWMPGWVMWLWNNGAEPISPEGNKAAGYLDSEKSVETVTFLRDLTTKYRVAPALSQLAAEGADPFVNGKAAMTVSGHWALIGYKNAPVGPDGKPRIDWRDLGVVALPHNTPTSNTVIYEAGYGITNRSKHKDVAWKFIKMWTGYKLQLEYNKSGIAVSARKDVAEELAKDPVDQEFLSIIPTARPPAGSWVESYEVVEAQGEKAMETILNNPNTDIRSVLRRAAQRIDHEFAKRL